MRHPDELKRVVAQEIDRRGEELVRVAQAIVQHPEPGFRETRTAALVQRGAEVVSKHRARLSKAEYLALLRGMARVETYAG